MTLSLGVSNRINKGGSENCGGDFLLIECTDASLSSGTSSLISLTNAFSGTRLDNDTLTTKFDVLITDPDGVDGSDDVSIRVGQGSGTNLTDIINGTGFISAALSQLVVRNITKVSTCSGDNWDNNFIIVFTITNDKPSFETKIFIKNLSIIHKNSIGTVIETLTFDFSSNGSVPANLDGVGAFDPSSSTSSVGNRVPIISTGP